MVAMIWGRADESNPANGVDPCDFGSNIDGNSMYVTVWTSGPVLPHVISSPPDKMASELSLEGEDFVHEEIMNLVNDQEPEWSENCSDDDFAAFKLIIGSNVQSWTCILH